MDKQGKCGLLFRALRVYLLIKREREDLPQSNVKGEVYEDFGTCHEGPEFKSYEAANESKVT